MEKKFDEQYFIKRFLKIPPHRWTSASLGKQDDADGEHCALGHLGVYYSNGTGGNYAFKPEDADIIQSAQSIYMKLWNKIGHEFDEVPSFYHVYNFNDGCVAGYQGLDPRRRMVCSLIKQLKDENRI